MVSTEIRLIIFFAAEDGEALFSQQKQDWELTMAQIVNSLLKKVGKTTRSFRYDLNQISYDYTVHIIPEELCTEVHDVVQETVIKTIP